MTPNNGCNFVLAQIANLQTLKYADYVLMSVGAVIVIATIVVPAIRSRRPIRFTFHRRTRIPLEAILIPIAAFILAASAAPLLFPASNQAQNELNRDDAKAEQTSQRDTTEALDPIQAVATTNIAMLTGAIAAFVMYNRYVRPRSRGVFWTAEPPTRQVIDGVAAALIAFAICYSAYQLTIVIMQWANPDFVPIEHQAIEAMQSADRRWWLTLLIWLGTCVITPFAEELFFRGLLQTALLRAARKRWLAILLSAVVFSAGHARQIHVVPAIFLFGVILGAIYERRGALAGPIIAHALFNAKTILWQTLSDA